MNKTTLATLLKKEIKEYIKTRRLLVVGIIYFAAVTILAAYYGRHGGVESLIKSQSFWMVYAMLPTLLALILSHDAIAGERMRGSLEFLLSRPVSKSMIIAGKFLSLFFILGAVVLGAGAYGYWLCALVSWDFPAWATTADVFKGFLVTYFAGTCWISFGLFFSSWFKSPGTCLATVILLWALVFSMLPWVPLGIYISEQGGPEKITSIPLWMKVLFAISPDAVAAELGGHIGGKPATGLNFYILSVEECIGVMGAFLAIFLISAFLFFRRLSLE